MCTIIEYHRWELKEVKPFDKELFPHNKIKGIAEFEDKVDHCDTGEISDEEAMERARRWLNGHEGKVILFFDDEPPMEFEDVAKRRDFFETVLLDGYIVKVVNL